MCPVERPEVADRLPTSALKTVRPAAFVPSGDGGMPPRVPIGHARFLAETDADPLEAPPRFIHFAVWSTLAFLIVFLVWAALANIEEITVADGKVIPSSQVQVVQNLEGGIVAEIRVAVGDMVRRDDVLMVIDDTRFVSSFEENKARRQALQAKIARLSAEAEGRPFEAPEALRREHPELVSREESLFRSRTAELNANSATLRQQLAQRSQELTEKRSRIAQLRESLALISEELAISRPIAAAGAMSPVEILRLERQENDLKGELEANRLSIPRVESSMAEVRSRLDGYIAKFRGDALVELNQARAEEQGNAAMGVALEDRVARTSVRSPVNGTIKTVKVTTVGGVVQPGSDLVEIVPLEDRLLVQARVRPSDIAFLHPGQEALVKLTAYDFAIYGGFPATLEQISADTTTNDRGESFYLVRVRTTSDVPSGSKASLAILPGMTATVHIRTGERTFLQYLLKPIIKTKERAFRER